MKEKISDKELLEQHGWIICCESPFELEYEETRDTATGHGAYAVLNEIRLSKVSYKTQKLLKKLKKGKIDNDTFLIKLKALY